MKSLGESKGGEKSEKKVERDWVLWGGPDMYKYIIIKMLKYL
jgi:hypothetical protein